ncbi:MAG: tetratricopeptide repeat protein, partial [Myxococcota bacterium]
KKEPNNRVFKKQKLNFLFSTRQYPQIIKALKPQLKASKPNRQQALLLLRAYYHIEDWKTGRNFTQALLRAYPKDAEVFFRKGLFEEGNQTLSLAFQSYRKALELDPKHTAAFLGQLRTAYKSQQNQLLKTLQPKLKTFPIQSVDHRIGMARWLLLNNKSEEALKHVHAALEQFPRDELLHKQAGTIAQQRKEFAKAQYHFQQALNIFPQDKHALLGLAKALEAQKKFNKSIPYYKRYLKQTRNEDPEALFRLGRIHFLQQKYKRAEQRIKRALSFNDKMSSAYFYLYLCAQALKRPLKKAQLHLERAIRYDPNNRSYQYQMAKMLHKQQKIGPAFMVFSRMLKLKQSRTQKAEIYFERAQLFFEAQNWQRAIKDYRKALQLDRKMTQVYIKIGTAYFEQRALRKAEHYYRKALPHAKVKAKAKLYARLGNIYRDQNKMSRALVHYRKSVQYDPSMYDIYRRLAYVYKDRKQWTRCVRSFRKFLKKAPKDNIYRKNVLIDLQSCRY